MAASGASEVRAVSPRVLARAKQELTADSWNPSRHPRSIALVLVAELPLQSRFLIRNNEHMRGPEHTDRISRNVPRVEQPGLPNNHERNSDVHRVPNITMQSSYDQLLRRRNRSRRSTADQCEAPESRIEINRNPDDNHANRQPFSRARDRRCVLPQTPRHVAGDRTGHDSCEQRCLQ
jgi:hypothetical protein